jgi:hypothetical protein
MQAARRADIPAPVSSRRHAGAPKPRLPLTPRHRAPIAASWGAVGLPIAREPIAARGVAGIFVVFRPDSGSTPRPVSNCCRPGAAADYPPSQLSISRCPETELITIHLLGGDVVSAGGLALRTDIHSVWSG